MIFPSPEHIADHGCRQNRHDARRLTILHFSKKYIYHSHHLLAPLSPTVGLAPQLFGLSTRTRLTDTTPAGPTARFIFSDQLDGKNEIRISRVEKPRGQFATAEKFRSRTSLGDDGTPTRRRVLQTNRLELAQRTVLGLFSCSVCVVTIFSHVSCTA